MVFSKKKILKYQETGLGIFIIFTYVLMSLYLVGISNSTIKKFDTIDKYLRICVSLFLIYRFNPFRKNNEFNSLDRRIAFSSGLFLFIVTFLGVFIFKSYF